MDFWEGEIGIYQVSHLGVFLVDCTIRDCICTLSTVFLSLLRWNGLGHVRFLPPKLDCSIAEERGREGRGAYFSPTHQFGMKLCIGDGFFGRSSPFLFPSFLSKANMRVERRRRKGIGGNEGTCETVSVSPNLLAEKHQLAGESILFFVSLLFFFFRVLTNKRLVIELVILSTLLLHLSLAAVLLWRRYRPSYSIQKQDQEKDQKEDLEAMKRNNTFEGLKVGLVRGTSIKLKSFFGRRTKASRVGAEVEAAPNTTTSSLHDGKGSISSRSSTLTMSTKSSLNKKTEVGVCNVGTYGLDLELGHRMVLIST